MNPLTPPVSQQTPTSIIHVVVVTSAFLVVVFFLTLAVMQFMHTKPDEQVFDAFKMAGTSAMSFFFGMLVNTRTAKAAPTDDATSTTETTVTAVESTAPKA